ncbi:MAG: hypothetical protein A2842_01670 [Candidatus Wildermuthbacteria bacterium RIFCSPHIGHO2_01_FULL_48_25]|uniref:Antitoxin n=1 Tax=Candidatus Wildermuthbacteria bacterium RIFCSPLOWO2_01_FULL_48_16 TaxID=1802461 RepID=A0A1G2RKX0_9BACT|nr:MAG: hypothetical protein A2842_01670 [Candidatus Wildermuthbacteria bacterium RIFCSPHIGHO2_01_FULL_48_25]OHA69150.1 MAG: hypothetical protein A3J57_00115 [Candidatus Wildermuthbacteria bacterium RIFCSPHIGHO2_02_FULL_49_12b]OHA73495.1 MAG: hypothetical protein A3B24_03220 [Candidatus Wildermuthbacteria bacterium RIFCSPLOWO2_01_FULL_48_16]
MDLNEIKELLGNTPGKVVIVENGKPSIIILSYEEYRRGKGLSRPEEAPPLESEPQGELTVDDLPL